MSKVIKLSFLKRGTPSSLLGLVLDGGRLEGVVLRRSNGSLQVHQRFSAALSVDLLTNEPELVARDILNQLEAAGVRERRCVIGVPLKWVMAAHTKIPELPAADVASYLQIEEERGFPTDVSTLQVATSRLVSTSGEQHAAFIGIPKAHLERLEQVIRAAKLKPLSFSLGITALQPAWADDSTGVMAVVIGEDNVGMQITCGGGVAAMRALEGAMDTESGSRVLQGERVAREARITLGQLSADLRDSVKRIRIFGPREQAQKLGDEIRPRFEPSGIKVELVTTYPPNEFGKTIPADTTVSPAFSLAARTLTGRTGSFEFLPPKVSAWSRMTTKYAPGKLRKVAAVAAALVVMVLGLFGFQQWQLTRLRAEWKAMEPKYVEIDTIDKQIHKYRPWFDNSFRYLSMMKDLANAFTPDGAMTAKTLEIRELVDRDSENHDINVVTCSGNADSYTSVVKTYRELGSITGVTNLTYQIRGKAPMQFTYDFHINGGVR